MYTLSTKNVKTKGSELKILKLQRKWEKENSTRFLTADKRESEVKDNLALVSRAFQAEFLTIWQILIEMLHLVLKDCKVPLEDPMLVVEQNQTLEMTGQVVVREEVKEIRML